MRTKLLLLIGGLTLGLTTFGVQIKEAKDLPRELHIINLDAHGNVLRPDDGDTPFGSKKEEEQYFETMISHAGRFAANGGRILIFIHGGLNGKSAGIKRFEEQGPLLRKAGYHPIFILWPSGIFDTYGYHLVRLRPPERSNALEKTVAVPFNFLADSARAVGRAPLVMINLMRNDYEATIASDAFTGPKLRNRLTQFKRLEADLTNAHVRIEKDHRTKASMAGRSLSYIVTLPFKLATAPIIDAFGKSGWHEMNARLDRIASRQIPHERGRTEAEKAADPRPLQNPVEASALARFFDRLEHSPQSEKVTLVGHSMGAILINKVLPDYKGKLDRVVFLAAACSVDDFERGALRYLERQTNGVQFFNHTLHPVAEARELDWRFLDLIPRGSLLVWIDEFLDQPRSPGQRRLGKWDNYFRVDDHMEGIDNSVPFVERVSKPPFETSAWVRAFGVGDKSAKTNGSPWNRFAAKAETYAMETYPQTHSQAASCSYWEDEYLYNGPRPPR